MGSLEEIYWNMAKNNGKLEHIMLSCPHSDGNYLINNALYMSASSLCSHKYPHALSVFTFSHRRILLIIR